MTPPTSLSGRVALVTGASLRFAIGAAVVRRLATDGAAVLVRSWPHADAGGRTDPGEADKLVDELRASGGNLTHISANLADPDADWVTGQTIASDGGWSLLGA